MSIIDVSVIIVSWNTQDILRNCLKSIYEQDCDISIEVIVIDNASTDGSAEMVKENFPQAILIENSENRGFATANNQGITEAKGRYVLLLNSDTVILDNSVEKTISFADAHPEAAVIGCRVLNPDLTLQPTCFMFPSILNMVLSSTYLYKIFPKSRFFGREQMTWWDRSDTRQVEVVTGCFMFVRREAIEQVGTMDEQFFMYGEETDWCYRFKQANWKIMFTPSAEIIHLGGQSSAQLKLKMILQLRASILYFIAKNRGPVQYKIACILTCAFFLFRIPGVLLLSVLQRNRGPNTTKVSAYWKGICKSLLGWRALAVKKD
ncbi:MAG: glycosyltransferase family 2 protein [Sedimentisphaerales bacterium]|nr:glycosyltransferase family 2 protein [Sedimentisphaerales bacterium]